MQPQINFITVKYFGDKDTIAEGNVKIKKSNELNALADKCVISPGYEKFKIIEMIKHYLNQERKT